jgi:4-carboxymuconolactone decarboxylase
MGIVGEPNTGEVWYDIDARERQVIGEAPRIAPLSQSEMDEEANTLVFGLRQALGIPADREIPDLTLITLRHPGTFRCQMELGIELMGNGAIAPRERELAVLRTALLCGAPFEWTHHVGHAKRVGVTDEEIDRVAKGSSALGWQDHDRAVLRAVEELIADKCISDETWKTLSKRWDEKQLLEMPMLVGCYFMLALQQNSIRVQTDTGLRQR